MSDDPQAGELAEPVDSSFLARLARYAAIAAGAALVGVTAIQAWQVFARYVLNDSPGWTEPLALLLLNAAMSLGAAAAVRSGSHFGFQVLVQASPPRVANALRALADLLMAGVGAVIACYGFVLLADGWNVRMAGAPLPQGAPFLPMSIGGAMIVVFALERLASRFRPARIAGARP